MKLNREEPMKKPENYKDNTQKYMTAEESAEYWDNHDTTNILENGDKIKLNISKPDYHCTTCGSVRIRKRIIDLPALGGAVILKKTKVLFCTDCNTYIIEGKGLEEIRDKLHNLMMKLKNKNMAGFVREGLASYERRWTGKSKERKVISIYFPTKTGSPAKAHISILVSDPLYPKLHLQTSEDVRRLLGIQYFEDLDRAAKKQNRTISQYLKLEISKHI